jgi:colanic acid biosynthesis glycosyl transferase WcaI
MNYAPERTGIAPYTTDLAEYLAARGHQVTVATTFPHYPAWRTQEAYQNKRALTEAHNGVTIHRRAVALPRKATTLRRVLYDTSLGLGALHSGWRAPADVILAVEPPIQAGVAARLLARGTRVPYLIWIQDLALEAATAVGMMRDSWALRAGRQMEEWAHAGAERLLVISHGFRDNLVGKGMPRDKVEFLPNWAAADLVRAQGQGCAFRYAHAIPEHALVVLHSGNMGVKQQLENVLDAAVRLKLHPEIYWLLVGDGSQRDALAARVAREQLENVHMLPLQPRETLPDLLAAADIVLVNQHPDVVEAVIPSKLIMYMAAARPVVVAAHSESEAVRQLQVANCGVWVPPGEPDALAGAVLELGNDPLRRAQLGVQGRAFVQGKLAREPLLGQLEDHLLAAARGRVGAIA